MQRSTRPDSAAEFELSKIALGLMSPTKLGPTWVRAAIKCHGHEEVCSPTLEGRETAEVQGILLQRLSTTELASFRDVHVGSVFE